MRFNGLSGLTEQRTLILHLPCSAPALLPFKGPKTLLAPPCHSRSTPPSGQGTRIHPWIQASRTPT